MSDRASEDKKQETQKFCACRAGSFKELYAAHFEPLVAYLRSRFRSCTQQAEEIAQDAFEKVGTMDNFETVGNFKAYLWRSAHNLAVSDIRSRRLSTKYQAETRQLFWPDDGYRLTPERVLETNEQLKIALAVLHKMPEQRRRAFILTRIEGLSHTEAAERMGVSRPAVSKHVAKATADLYAALHNESSSGKK